MTARRFGLTTLVARSLRQHALSSVVTSLSVALAVGLVMAVFAIRTQAHAAFTGGSMGFDAVLGARGSQLQLVLNSVFHLETSPGSIPWALYKAIEREPGVAAAIPYAVGDNYHGFRIVGTDPRLFLREDPRGRRWLRVSDGGRLFDASAREAVVGSVVAGRTGLGVGDTFSPYHGLQFDEGQRHEERYTVVGVLEPTNGPADRVVWVPIEGVYRLSGHVLRGAGELYRPREDEAIPEEHREVSAVMLQLRDPRAGLALDQTVNRQGTVATLTWPVGRVMADLFDRLGWVTRVLELVALLVALVATASILAALYNTMNERRREFAILRALGARRLTLSRVIVLEAAAIAGVGAVAAYVVYAVIAGAAFVVVREHTGVSLDVFRLDPSHVWAPWGALALGALAGLAPAWAAYRVDVAEHLAPTS